MGTHVKYFETMVKGTILMYYFLSDVDNMGKTQNTRASNPIAMSKADCCQRVWGIFAHVSPRHPHSCGDSGGAGLNSGGGGPTGKWALLKTRKQGSIRGGKIIMFSFSL